MMFDVEIKYDKNGLVPVIAQDIQTKEVLMLAYANREALEKTVETGLAHYYSRSRNCLWQKGATSGCIQQVREILSDCDGDSLVYLVEQTGAACHTGERTCFYTQMYSSQETGEGSLSATEDKAGILREIYAVVTDRVKNPKEGSYTNYLLGKGIDKILKKVGEETAETIIAAKNNDRKEIALEVSDLLYHLIVMLVERGMELDEVFDVLKGRR